MADYAQFSLVHRYLQGSPKADAVAVQQAISAASRMFDRLANVSPNFFATASGIATEKSFALVESSAIQLSPFVPGSIVEIDGAAVSSSQFLVVGEPPRQVLDFSINREFYVGDFNYVEDRYFQTNNVRQFYRTIKVKADWGFSQVPADVSQAVVMLAIKLLRETDGATVQMADVENQVTNAVPPLVAVIADAYKEMSLVKI